MERITIYLNKELKKRLSRLAKEEKRSLSNQALFIIEEWLKKLENKK